VQNALQSFGHILITGSAGSGTTSLGEALSKKLGISFFDADNYFWLPTEPPFQKKRDVDTRLTLVLKDLSEAKSTVIAGSVMNWGSALENAFCLIVFLTLDAEIRVNRLRTRELAQFGKINSEFIEWARQYEEGALEGRSRARHEKWLSERTCPILRLDGDLSIEERVNCVMEAIANSRTSNKD